MSELDVQLPTSDVCWRPGDLFLALDRSVAVFRAVDGGKDFEIVDFNPAAERIDKVVRDDVVGRLVTEVFPGVEEFGLLDVLRRVCRHGRSEVLPASEYVDERLRGWRENRVIRLAEGLVAAVYEDVTQRVEAEHARAESEQRFRLLTESSLDGIWNWNVVDNELYLSPRWKSQLGYGDTELRNAFETWTDLLHPDDRQRVLDHVSSFVDAPEAIWEDRFRLRHKYGHYIWLLARGSAVLDERNRLVRILGVHVDIDRSRRAEIAERRKDAVLEAVFESLPDLFFLVDADGVIVDYRARQSDDLYVPPEQFLGRRMVDVLPEEPGRLFTDAIARADRSGELVTIEYALDIHGSQRDFEARISPLRGQQHDIVVVRDITDQKRMELALKERIKEMRCLYSIHRDILGDTSEDAFFENTVRQLEKGLQFPDLCVVTITAGSRHYGNTPASPHPDRMLCSPIKLKGRTVGRVEVGYSAQREFLLPEEQQLVNGVAEGVSTWLERRQAEDYLRRYENIVSMTPDLMSYVDRDYIYRLVNDAYASMLKRDKNDVIGHSVASVVGESMFSKIVKPHLDDCFAGKDVHYVHEFELGGAKRYMDVRYHPHRTHAGSVLGAVVNVRDITASHEAQERIRQAAEVFKSTVEGVTITDLDGAILDVNDAFSKITGYSREEVIGENPRILQSGWHDADFYRRMWESLRNLGYWRGEIWNRRKNGIVYPELLTISAVRDDDGQASGYVAVFADITMAKQTEEQLDHLAHHDALTQLPNRLLFNARLEQSILHSQRQGSSLAVAFVDLDRFKKINDSLGHAAGDQLLVQIAERLTKAVRADDTIARISGDEFVALLEHVGDVCDVKVIVQKIMETFHEPFAVAENVVHMTCSIGISLYPDDGKHAADLLRNADTAMYRAKEEGRNTYQFYTEEMTTEAFEQMFLENALRTALNRDELQLFYQPQFEMHSGRCIGVEALVRWQHPEQGTILPGKFIPVAEKSDLIRDIGEWVLWTACSQVKEWLQAGVEFGCIAVNVSSSQIQQAGFAQHVLDVLETIGLPPTRLEIEVTETSVMHRPEQSIQQLKELEAIGVSIAIDDFGTGYSSLSYLKQLPVSKLKIDRSFIRDIPVDTNDMAISEAVIALGKTLNMAVIAEGVETSGQAEFLQAKGCSLAQGYYYAKPQPVDRVVRLFGLPGPH